MLLNIQWVYAYILQDVYEENLKPERPFTCYSILASKDYSCLMDGHLVALFIGCKFNKLLKLIFTCTHPFLFLLITISFFQFSQIRSSFATDSYFWTLNFVKCLEQDNLWDYEGKRESFRSCFGTSPCLLSQSPLTDSRRWDLCWGVLLSPEVLVGSPPFHIV